MNEDEQQKAWIRRFEVVGRAQARLLWVVLVVTIFYLALQDTTIQSVTVPIVNIQLSTAVVLAVGGPTLSLLLISIVGSFVEWGRTAEKAFGKDWRECAEQFDLYPTVFDFAHYTVRGKSRVLNVLAYFLFYPTFLLAALLEAGALVLWLWRHPAPARAFLLILGASLWLWAALLIIGEVWWTRLKGIPALWRRSGNSTG